MKELRNELVNASKLKQSGKHDQALEIYEKLYREHPDEFKRQHKVDYAWTIIKVKMLDSEDEFFDAARQITELLPQADLNVKRSCPYTSAVFKVLIKLKDDNDYISMIPWLEKLNPELLDEEPYRSHGRLQKPRREKWYDWAGRAYLDDMQFEKCIEVSKEALKTLKSFKDDGDTWHKRRIAKSYKELQKPKEALAYYREVINVKHDWYIYRDIAEIYHSCGMNNEALDYLCPAILSNEPDSRKANIYLLAYRVLNAIKYGNAQLHAQFYYLLQKQNGYAVPYDIEKLGFDEMELDKRQIQTDIRKLWTQYKFKNQKLQHGTVIKFNAEKNYGFIKTGSDESIFFHKSDFSGENVYIGQLVSFYTEENFDKSKNRKSTKAVNVRGD